MSQHNGIEKKVTIKDKLRIFSNHTYGFPENAKYLNLKICTKIQNVSKYMRSGILNRHPLLLRVNGLQKLAYTSLYIAPFSQM